MRLSGKFKASLLFFLQKDFERTKTQINQNQPTKTKLSKPKTTKATSKRMEIFGAFCTLKIFSKKKKKNWL